MPITNGVTIRIADRGDFHSIQDLIVQLANHVGHPISVENYSSALRDFLDNNRCIRASVAVLPSNEIVGVATYYPTFSTFRAARRLWIEDLFVVNSARRMGVGRTLMQHALQQAAKMGCIDVQWVSGCAGSPSGNFYSSLGAAISEDSRLYRVQTDATLNVP